MTDSNELAIAETLYSNELGTEVEIVDIRVRRSMISDEIETVVHFEAESGKSTFVLTASTIYELIQSGKMEWSR